ncbi:hypothetical protein EAG_01474 [Camponotus floridanus]|uniref:Uncharacterized protein n=1 Tax=Camponotus floridanus TaxID=104421 RepID=E2A8S8_CAMFO|nr:hypothetical protein EAG_01474 [Camponotus floridanus]
MEEVNRCQKSPRSWRRWNSWRIWPGGSTGVTPERFCSMPSLMGSKIESLMRFVEELPGALIGDRPVLLNDVNPTSFLAIRNTNRDVLRSDPSRFSLRL